MANKHRGEEELRLAGRTYVLRPTFQALAEIEAELDEKLLRIAERSLAGNIGTKETLAVVRAFIRGGGAEPPSDLEAAIMQRGVLVVIGTVLRAIQKAISGDPEDLPTGNPPAAETA